MADRIISGVLTSLCIAITCLFFAFFMATYRGGMSLNWGAAFEWIGSVGIIGFVAGFVMGFDRTLEMIAQLWGTAQNPNPALRAFLIVALITLWILSYHFTSSKL
jgi:hypothetical protein